MVDSTTIELMVIERIIGVNMYFEKEEVFGEISKQDVMDTAKKLGYAAIVKAEKG